MNIFINIFRILLCFVLLCGTTEFIPAQTREIDSVRRVLDTAKHDSVKIHSLRYLAVSMSDYDVVKAIELVNEAVTLAKQKNLLAQHAHALLSKGIIYYGLGDYAKTLDCFYQSLTFYEKEDNKENLSKIYNNLGVIYKDLGQYQKSVSYLEKAIQLKEDIRDINLPSTYNNLGSVYDEGLQDYEKAAAFYRKALEIDKAHNDTYGTFITLGNIGYNFYRQQEYDSAEHYFNQAVMLIDKTDDKYVKAEFLYHFALLNAAMGEHSRAIEKHNMSLEMAKESDAKLILRNNYKGLASIHESLGDFEKALMYHKMYSDMNQQIFNVDRNEKMAEVETNFHIRTKQNEIELLKKEAEIKDLRLSNREMALYWVGGVLLLVALIVFLLYKKNIYRKRTNLLLKRKNSEIISKNKNIMDSIIYARSIQEAILPEHEKLKRVFKDAFIFSKARDVVSGDFYWFSKGAKHCIVAAVDCTGHGVPAAFLNVMANSLLNQIVNDEKILQPGEILKALNLRLFKNLKYNNLQNNSNDGMDIAICLFKHNTGELSFAGAKRPLYYVHQGQLHVFKGDPYPIGGLFYEDYREYTEHQLDLSPGDCIYLFTDGIVDQFGGTHNKKFMYPRFRNLLAGISCQSMEQQMDTIAEEMRKWQGAQEQTDDMLLIGIRV